MGGRQNANHGNYPLSVSPNLLTDSQEYQRILNSNNKNPKSLLEYESHLRKMAAAVSQTPQRRREKQQPASNAINSGNQTLNKTTSTKKVISPRQENQAAANRKKLEYETLYAKIKFQDMEISDTHRNASITGSKVGNVQDSIGSLDSFLIS